MENESFHFSHANIFQWIRCMDNPVLSGECKMLMPLYLDLQRKLLLQIKIDPNTNQGIVIW